MLVMFLPLLQSACCQCQEWIKSQVLPADETSYENFTPSPLSKELTDACTESQQPLLSGRPCGVWALAGVSIKFGQRLACLRVLSGLSAKVLLPYCSGFTAAMLDAVMAA